MAKAKRSPLEVTLSADALAELEQRLAREIRDGMDARQRIVGDQQEIDRWHLIYEGGPKKLTKDFPWPNAANLTSYIGTEKVDAWRARIVNTIFKDYVWFVEGFGEAAARASQVEEFHQWKVEEERLQQYLGKVIHNGLIEGTGVLEVAERPQPRLVFRQVHYQPTMLPDGGVLRDPEMGEPVPMLDPKNQPIEVDAGTPFAIAKLIQEVVNVGAGPQYRVVSLKDFAVLPGHANDVKDVWGYAKRFWMRLPVLEAREKAGYYKGVDRLTSRGDRMPRAEDTRAGQDIAVSLEPREEKEIWELTFLDDLSNLGNECWYVATISVLDNVILRLQHLAVGQPTYMLYTPFPRPNSIYGYSAIGNKLATLIDEHTAIRNQITDRSTMVNAAPVKRVVGSLWDPQEQPWGPMQIIDVRDMNEVEPFQMPDVPGSMIQRESTVLAASERVSGINDTALGTQPQQDRTLGEVTLVSNQSFIRVEEVVKYFQEPMEQLFALRHELWKRALSSGAQQLPPTVIAILEGRGVQVPNQVVDASILNGVFRGKPAGSVDGADPNRRRNDFTALLNSLAQLIPVIPALQMHLNTPQAVQAILEQAMRIFAWKDRQALLGVPSPAGFGQQLQGIPNLLGGAGGGGAQPGLPQPGRGTPPATR